MGEHTDTGFRQYHGRTSACYERCSTSGDHGAGLGARTVELSGDYAGYRIARYSDEGIANGDPGDGGRSLKGYRVGREMDLRDLRVRVVKRRDVGKEKGVIRATTRVSETALVPETRERDYRRLQGQRAHHLCYFFRGLATGLVFSLGASGLFLPCSPSWCFCLSAWVPGSSLGKQSGLERHQVP